MAKHKILDFMVDIESSHWDASGGKVGGGVGGSGSKEFNGVKHLFLGGVCGWRWSGVGVKRYHITKHKHMSLNQPELVLYIIILSVEALL